MKKASKPTITKFMQPYMSKDSDGEFISEENAKKVMSEIIMEFENAYAGIEPDKLGIRKFIVKSISTRNVFFSTNVR